MITGAGPYTEAELAIADRVREFTMTSGKFVIFTQRLMRDLNARDVPGAVVECGVWRGGQIMAAAMADDKERDYWLYDTFEGMQGVSEHDYREGKHATDSIKWRKGGHEGRNWCRAELEDVQANVWSVVPPGRTYFIKGDVNQTLKSLDPPDQIALLRLDTDFYLSTKIELEVLYPRLVSGGYLVIDDYHSWDGAKKAVDEYFGPDQEFTKQKFVVVQKP
jgi:hypothetical protein